jgi:hypothetical protein
MRTRAVEQDDVHVFCREDDVPDEVARFIGRLSRVYSDLGSRAIRWVFFARLTSRAVSDELWVWAEALLGDAARQCGLRIPFNPVTAPSTDPSSNSPCKTVEAAWQYGTVRLVCVAPGKFANVETGARHGSISGSKIRADTETYSTWMRGLVDGINYARSKVEQGFVLMTPKEVATAMTIAVRLNPYP